MEEQTQPADAPETAAEETPGGEATSPPDSYRGVPPPRPVDGVAVIAQKTAHDGLAQIAVHRVKAAIEAELAALTPQQGHEATGMARSGLGQLKEQADAILFAMQRVLE